jgi:hypothetical protein
MDFDSGSTYGPWRTGGLLAARHGDRNIQAFSLTGH